MSNRMVGSSCRGMDRLLSEYLDGLLGGEERCRVEEHLGSCADCAGVLADYRSIGERLRRAPRVTPPAAVRRVVFTRAGRQSRHWAGLGAALLRSAAAGAVLVLWVGLVVWLFRGGTAVRLPEPTAGAGIAAVSEIVPPGVVGGAGDVRAAIASAPAGRSAAATTAPEVVWAFGGELWAATPAATARKVATLAAPEGDVADFVLSRDGRRVAYIVHGVGRATLRAAEVTGGEPRPLLNARYLTGLTWSDSEHLSVFTGDDAGKLSLAVLDARDGSSTTRPLQAPFAYWSPDSRHLAYTEPLPRPGWQRLSVVAAANGARASAAEVALPEGYLAWAPDSSRLLFAAYTRRPQDGELATGPARIFSLRPGENTPVPVQAGAATGEADYLRPQLSPDGHSIAFLYHPRQPGERVPPEDASALHTDLAAMSGDGKGARSLAGAAPAERITGAHWSPDSRYLAYLTMPVGPDAGGAPGGQVWLIPAKGGSPLALSPRYAGRAPLGRVQWRSAASGD